MTPAATVQTLGAGFLLHEVDPATLPTPERLTDEHRMLRETTRRFVEAECLPRMEELERLNPALLRELLGKLGELGLCMIDIPEEYGGLGLDLLSSIQPVEILNRAGGFQVTHSVQTVIGVLPILYFGGEALKRRYLPKIATAELVTAYALTEPGSGSDALAARTTAVLTPDGGHWILNGSKQFITNGGLADLFIVFAQVNGREFSAFVVERGTPGFLVGAEEHKMGIRSSSTTTLSFTDARVPRENLIGEVGWGARIALNVLNVGRLKLGAAALGGAKEALETAVHYGLERRQFGRPIVEFGMIREKIAEMAARIYAGESTMVRTTGSVDAAIRAARAEAGVDPARAMMEALREFNVECAIEKVHGSEIQAYCCDEAVQIHGGYGFIEEYTVARLYRDARITRLYEGTNEINRMQIAGDVVKRLQQGTLPIGEPAGNGGAFGPLADVARRARDAKAALARLLQAVNAGRAGAVDKRGPNQEILPRLADIIIGVYGMESAMGRAVQARQAGHELADLFETMTRIYATHAERLIHRSAGEAVQFLGEGGAAGGEAEAVERLTLPAPRDVIRLRRRVAEAVIAREGIWF